MIDKDSPVTTKYQKLGHMHVVKFPGYSSLILVGRRWADIVKRADECLGLVLPRRVPRASTPRTPEPTEAAQQKGEI